MKSTLLIIIEVLLEEVLKQLIKIINPSAIQGVISDTIVDKYNATVNEKKEKVDFSILDKDIYSNA